MRSEVVFFINQSSGSGNAAVEAEEAALALPGLRIHANLPKSPLELSKLCTGLSPETTKAAVVFGGDGTQTYALRGLLQSGIPLYPFPSGTANDLATEQGINGTLSQLQNLIESNSIQDLRVLQVNGLPFSTVAGIGIGADLCAEYNRLRNQFPLFKRASERMNCEIYSALAAKQILTQWGSGLRLHVKGDQFDRTLDASVVMICNQSTLAGNLRVAPHEDRSSEEFTVLIHPAKCGFSTLRALAEMKLGRIHKSFITFKTHQLDITHLGSEVLKVFGDGEILTEERTLSFKLHPKRLKVFRA